MSVLLGTFRLSVVVAAMAVLASPALAKTVRWECNYLRAGEPLTTKDTMRLEFMVDDVSGTAVMIGNKGMSDVVMHVGSLGVTFMEKLASGAVQTTTIREGGGSVHSRHTMFPTDKTVTPSQYSGYCKIQ